MKDWLRLIGVSVVAMATWSSADDVSAQAAKLGVTWAGYSPKGYSDPVKQVGRFKKTGFRLVSLVPTFTYVGLNKVDFSKAPSFSSQEAAIEALLQAGIEVVYKPHLDPPLYQPGFRLLESDNHSWRANCPWRGYFDVDPMSEDYKDKIIFAALERIAQVYERLESKSKRASSLPLLRFDLGSELMNSVVHQPSRWDELQKAARKKLSALGLSGKVVLSHNFSHHFAMKQDFVGRMGKRERSQLAQYIKGLDAIALSQYMDLTVVSARAGKGESTKLPTPNDVAAALRLHERALRNDILKGALKIPASKLPVLHLGEFGIGRGGLRHPNVWDGQINEAQAQQLRQEIAVGYRGLVRYLRQNNGREAKSAVLWVLGKYFDIFGWIRESYRVNGACDAVQKYLSTSNKDTKRRSPRRQSGTNKRR